MLELFDCKRVVIQYLQFKCQAMGNAFVIMKLRPEEVEGDDRVDVDHNC
jgi:hypothetical protein